MRRRVVPSTWCQINTNHCHDIVPDAKCFMLQYRLRLAHLRCGGVPWPHDIAHCRVSRRSDSARGRHGIGDEGGIKQFGESLVEVTKT